MSIDNPYVAITALLMGNSNITDIVGKFLLENGEKGTIPLIKGGELAEKETDLPAIVFKAEIVIEQEYMTDNNFLLNCYGATELEAYVLAYEVIKQFNEVQTVINGYNCYTTCNIITSVVDPSSKQANVPIEFRLVNM